MSTAKLRTGRIVLLKATHFPFVAAIQLYEHFYDEAAAKKAKSSGYPSLGTLKAPTKPRLAKLHASNEPIAGVRMAQAAAVAEGPMSNGYRGGKRDEEGNLHERGSGRDNENECGGESESEVEGSYGGEDQGFGEGSSHGGEARDAQPDEGPRRSIGNSKAPAASPTRSQAQQKTKSEDERRRNKDPKDGRDKMSSALSAAPAPTPAAAVTMATDEPSDSSDLAEVKQAVQALSLQIETLTAMIAEQPKKKN